MSKNILSAVFFTLLVSVASAGPSQFISPSDIVQVKTNDEEDARDRFRWRESRSEADWYDGRQDDRAEAFRQYSFRPPEDDSDCFSVGGVWYCP